MEEILLGNIGKKAEQKFNPNSTNAQSGIAVEEARKLAVQEGKEYVDTVIGDINNVLATLVDIEGD